MVTAIWTTWMFLDISREIAWKFPAFCYTYFLGKCFLKIFLAKQGNDFRKISWEIERVFQDGNNFLGKDLHKPNHTKGGLRPQRI